MLQSVCNVHTAGGFSIEDVESSAWSWHTSEGRSGEELENSTFYVRNVKKVNTWLFIVTALMCPYAICV